MIVAIASYYGSSEFNEVTGTTQRIAMTQGQEIALGLQAAPQMAEEFGGLHNDEALQNKVDEIGQELIKENGGDKGYKFYFHLLADDKTVNAFALPGGQIFITYALFKRLNNDDQIAAVLSHEIGHVMARHGAQHLAKQQLAQGITTAAIVGTGDYSAGQMAAVIGQMVNMKYGRGDEIESDLLGVRFMVNAGYKPEAMIEVMKVLQEASKGKGNGPDFFSTHPNPENRIERIKQAIEETK